MLKKLFPQKGSASEKDGSHDEPFDVRGTVAAIANNPQNSKTLMNLAVMRFQKVHVKSVCAALQDPDKNVRTIAALLLKSFQDERALEPLRAACSDPDASVRHAVFQALCVQSGLDMDGVGHDERLDLWVTKDAKGTPLAVYIKTMDYISAMEPSHRKPLGKWAIPVLCVALLDQRPNIRVAAVNKLAEFDAKPAVDLLRVLLSDPDEIVRTAAERALIKLGVRHPQPFTQADNTQKVRELAETYINKDHPLDPKMQMMGIKQTRPTYQVVSNHVGRSSYPNIDIKIVSVASCLPGEDIAVDDTEKIARLALKAIEHYASLPAVQAFFLAPYRLRSGTIAKGSVIPPEEQCRVYAGVENLLLEIYDELPHNGTITDQVVEQKITKLTQ